MLSHATSSALAAGHRVRSNTGRTPMWKHTKGGTPMTEKTQPQSPSDPEGIKRHAVETEDTEGHEIKATEDTLEAVGLKRHATEGAPQPDGGRRS